ncbi:MAG: nucleotidyltransferase domain-containing protein [Ruminococcus sp.]|nr:nucleotidyltransferase domain-containing protein [Ruminococcus sp.]
MTDKIYTLEEIKAIVAPIAKKYHLKEVNLFGSYARGEATEKSDIDLVVDFYKTIDLFTLAEIIQSFETVLQKNVDVLIYKNLTPELMWNIIDDEVLIYA